MNSRLSHRFLLTLLASFCATGAVRAAEVGQHPALFSPRSLPAIDASTFVVAHPAHGTPVHLHANRDHPAVEVSRRRQVINTDAYRVQPPASTRWTLGVGASQPVR